MDVKKIRRTSVFLIFFMECDKIFLMGDNMKKSRQEQIEELQQKVFGKNAPKRNVPTSMEEMMAEATLLEQRTKENASLENLKTMSDAVNADLDKLEKTSSSMNEILEKQLKEIESMNASITQSMNTSFSGLNMKELNEFETEMTNDFNIEKDMSSYLDTLEEALSSSMVGQEKAIKEMIMAIKRPYIYKNGALNCLNSILIYGPKGSGKHKIVETISKHLQVELVKIDLSKYNTQEDEKLFLQDIYSAVYKKNSILLFENPETCFAGYLTLVAKFFKTGSIELKKRYTENKGQLQETNSTLVSNAIHSIDATNHYLFLLTDLKKNKIVDLLGIEFMNSLSDIIETEAIDSNLEKWIEIEFEELKENLGNIMNVELDDSVKTYYKNSYVPSGGLHSIDHCSDEVLKAISQYKLENKDVDYISLYYDEKLMIKENDDAKELFAMISKVDSVDIDEIKKELDEIVGLDDVKKYVLSLEDNYKIQKLREQQGLKTATISKHMIFTGNPGTGKTTIARLISKYLRAIGVLTGGQLIEVTRADLVGRYVGHTAPLTMQVIQSALGGVLFIDEAYSLYRGKDDSFGLECIDTIVKAIEDYRDNLIVILAGYKKEMNDFLESNSGLKSRFPNMIDFKDYTADELVQIAYINAKSKDYFINDECKEALYAYFDKIQKDNSKMSGNGRMARNKVEEAILNQASRILKDPSQNLQELKLEDFKLDDSSFVR